MSPNDTWKGGGGKQAGRPDTLALSEASPVLRNHAITACTLDAVTHTHTPARVVLVVVVVVVTTK